jgi:DNA-binding transcriptional MerR regulator
VDQPEFPNKLYFRIGEVAKIIGVKPYVLRYWETEFPILKPGKTPSRHRLYRRRDVELLLEIKRLLYEEGFTIAGAKKQLKDNEAAPPQPSQNQTPPPTSPKMEEMKEAEETEQSVQPPESITFEPLSHQLLREIREDLQALYKMLENKSA